MPYHQPVRGRRFVEQRRAKRKRFAAQDFARDSEEAGLPSYCADKSKSHRVPDARSAPRQVRLIERLDQATQVFWSDHVWNDRESLFFNRLWPTHSFTPVRRSCIICPRFLVVDPGSVIRMSALISKSTSPGVSCSLSALTLATRSAMILEIASRY